MSSKSFLQAQGSKITLDGKAIILKGTALGGWMNMENFITGYPAHEHQMRAALLRVLGKEKYEYFFDKFLEYFFTEEDAKLLASLGLNCLRLPVNYRHLEDDMSPRVFKKEGLKHLDRVVDLLAKHKIYSIIDLHSAPGGQNVDWHCDAGGHQALFWEHKDFQDRTVLIWEALAEHYKDNVWVAGYNPLNEPTDSEHTRLVAFYNRVETAIRAIDPHHILFLDGNTFGADFSQFKSPWPNSAYDTHDYSKFGFPNSELYVGSEAQKQDLESSFARKTQWMKDNDVPIWNGEFGPVYQSAMDGLPDWQEINSARYHMLKDQLEIYERLGSSWSIWTYKDIGFQGMVYVKPDSAYRTLLAPFLEKKKRIAADGWGADYTSVAAVFDPLEAWLVEQAPGLKTSYPKLWRPRNKVGRILRNILMSEHLVDEYAEFFLGKTTEELELLARSFLTSECQQRVELNEILKQHAQNSH